MGKKRPYNAAMSTKRPRQASSVVEVVQSFLIASGGKCTLSKLGPVVKRVKPKDEGLLNILSNHPLYFRCEKDPSDNQIHVELVNDNSPAGEISNNQDLAPSPKLRDTESEGEEEETDKPKLRRSKRLKCATPKPKSLTLKQFVRSFEVREMNDANDLPYIIATMSNESNNSDGDDRPSRFVGIDFRSDASGHVGPPRSLVDIMIGKSKFTFDCQAFSTVHGPHWLSSLLSNQRLCPMVASPRHLWERPPMACDLTNPFAERNTLDAQLVTEYLFREPYPEWESILYKLVNLRFGKKSLPRNSEQHPKHLFFHLLWDEMQHKLQEQDILLLQTATQTRMANINARYQFGFDSGNGYIKHGATLANLTRAYPTHPLRPQLFLDKIPLEESHDFNSLFECLPPRLLTYLNPWYPNIENFEKTITEIILDLGQPPYLWVDGRRIFFCNTPDSVLVEQEDIDHVLDRGQFRFGPDNRAAIAGQLHRIAAMKHWNGKIYGLTLRFGRHVKGNAGLILDILKGTTESILILGPPKSGKTTLVRDIARVLSEEVANTVIVDTSNEIGGDGERPHPCVGLARRMMVPSLEQQASVMLECLKNHNPHVMIIDEIGRTTEVEAAKTIKNRKVRLVASAHGDLRGLVASDDLDGLIGGARASTFNKGLAKRRTSASASEVEKVVTHRVGPPIFDVIIELDTNDKHAWKVITDPCEAVDAILNGEHYSYELRSRNPETFEMSLVRHSEG